MPLFNPLVVIIGTTGVGKSKLAVEIAQALGEASSPLSHARWKKGRVLNADAMQVYQGLDVITNKIPKEEQNGVEHCLMGFKQPGEQYVVGEWIRDATKIIDESHRNNILPVVAGGTLYWIQHLIFPKRLASSLSSGFPKTNLTAATPSLELSQKLESLSQQHLVLYNSLPQKDAVSTLCDDESLSLHLLLKELDPEMALRWHWKDSRKVLRSLEIIKENGRLASAIVHAQDSETSIPRYPTVVFWLYAEPDHLEPRLDSRVNEMVKGGLMDELIKLRDVASRLQQSASSDSEREVFDPNKGIFQTIGYKEFATYLATMASYDPPLNSQHPALSAGLDRMKLSTRQYARSQVKWIKNRLIPAINASKPSEMALAGESKASSFSHAQVYVLDATTLGEKWESNVRQQAVSIVSAFLQGHQDEMPDPGSIFEAAGKLLAINRSSIVPSATLAARRKRICEACTIDPLRPVMIEEGREWEVHLKTKAHRKFYNAENNAEVIHLKREAARRRAEEKAMAEGEHSP